ncbi:unnamed protein product [Gongylonema pulchrum]|uniref:BPTI/Kunitz inhibitor domain-containing protein n=1 Tax=Gongylonema pulchrum TaxID=637853 RepID=A0A183EM04_9BILA|nr:unnamed protein product [Gongylonema pulchrum]
MLYIAASFYHKTNSGLENIIIIHGQLGNHMQVPSPRQSMHTRQHQPQQRNCQHSPGANRSKLTHHLLPRFCSVNDSFSQLKFPDTSGRHPLTQEEVVQSNIAFACVPRLDEAECERSLCYNLYYRTMDGTCNNLARPLRGAAFRPYNRYHACSCSTVYQSIQMRRNAVSFANKQLTHSSTFLFLPPPFNTLSVLSLAITFEILNRFQPICNRKINTTLAISIPTALAKKTRDV